MAGEKCASDDNESNRASTTPSLPLPRDVAAKVLTKAGRNQKYILWESCCLKLKDSFVHHSRSNSMGLTPSRRCLHI